MPPAMKTTETEQAICFAMVVYAKADETLVAAYPIQNLSLPDLQRLFGVPPENPMVDCWPVRADQVSRLEQATGRKLDLVKYDCFVERCSADS